MLPCTQQRYRVCAEAIPHIKAPLSSVGPGAGFAMIECTVVVVDRNLPAVDIHYIAASLAASDPDHGKAAKNDFAQELAYVPGGDRCRRLIG